ncbi:MAG: endonuclease MutS2 [Campylobacter sp.]|nr:endonuclease MutS2 [Campylobacter sp.]
MNSELFARLDLDEYLAKFHSFLSREKPLFLQGDIKIASEYINELSKFEITPPKSVANLDDALIRLSKFAALHISEIYEFAKIISYFCYIKKLEFGGSFKEWLDKIEIKDEMIEISNYFDDKGELKESVDERFRALKNAYRMKKDEINNELKRLIYSKNITPYLVDTQIHYINDSETLLVRGGFNHALKGKIVARSSGGYFYIFPTAISKLKSEQEDILLKNEEIIYEYCKKISEIFNKNLPFLKFINRSYDRLDSLLARVFMAKTNDYEFVLSDSSKDIILSEFAHPALKNPKRVSVSFTKKVLLITGVNAGGKSMLLKSILSAALLAKYLLPMPINSSKSKIGNFKELDIIMEDPQNVKNDISTFAGRMAHFSQFFGKKNMLIGIDEIELGTDFEEGASLYAVLINKLIQNDVKLVITTHHKRLAMILAKHSEVELLAALYDEKLALPKYEFLSGIIGKSYAFETALRYGIPANFVSEAKAEYGLDKENLNEMINKAVNLELELKTKLEENKNLEIKLQKTISNLSAQKENHENEQKKLISKLEFEYYQAIKEVKKTLNLKDTKDKQRALNRANELIKSIEKPKFSQKEQNVKVGDYVKYQNIKGQILSINKNEALIDANGINLRIKLNSLKPSSKPPKSKNSVKLSIEKPSKASVSIDLHGLRSQEAINLLDKFISDSLVLGFDEVLVKHGIGTGKLAYAVKEFLKAHPSVREFYDAPPSDGGFGAKVVRL